MKYFNLAIISTILISLIYSSANFVGGVEREKYLAEQKAEEQRLAEERKRIEEKQRIALAKFKKDLECLASVVYHEARGEPVIGQIAVAQVVLNRVQSKHFPSSICKVAFQPHQFTDLSGIKYNQKTLDVALKVYTGAVKFKTNATHYHADYVDPYWASSEKKEFLGRIGRHLFYRAKWA